MYMKKQLLFVAFAALAVAGVRPGAPHHTADEVLHMDTVFHAKVGLAQRRRQCACREPIL